jgi:hypothetical protein
MAEALQAGTHASRDDGSMTDYIEQAMREEWLAARGQPLPADGPGAQDRRILFAAVAKGVLRYLYVHRADLLTSTTIDDGGGPNHRHDADFDLVERP